MSFTSSVAEAVEYNDASGRNPNRETTFSKVSVGQNAEVERILSQLNNETRNRMRFEVISLFVKKKSAVTGVHFVFLSLKQIGTADVYISRSTGPSSSKFILETVDNVDIYIYIYITWVQWDSGGFLACI